MPIGDWLRGIGLGALVQTFEQADVDLDVVADLTDSDLRDLGLSLGQRKRLLRAARRLAEAGGPPPEAAQRPEPVAADRRHLTVMFCDMVGSTALSERLDAEDLLQIVQSYQRCCTSIVHEYEGYVARYQGDGVLVYFGYPMAHEAAPEHALRAALDIVKNIPKLKLPGGIKLQVRIGIASGVVVVGDLLVSGPRIEQPALGVAPNLAARLQGIAEPNQIVVADVTYRLAHVSFDFKDLGQQRFRGILKPTRVWQLLHEAPRRGMTALLGQWRQIPFTNRKGPRALMQQRWDEVRNGHGQVILLSGGPGIGKSCLLHHFLAWVEDNVTVQIYHGSSYNQDSPLHPIIQGLRSSGGIERNDDAATIRSKLEQIVVGTDPQREKWLDSLISLLRPVSVSPAGSSASAKQIRERTLDALVAAVLALSEVRPVIIVMEDFHWLDPTSIELLDRTLHAIENCPILVLVSSREAFKASWAELSYASSIELRRLQEHHSRELITNLAGGTMLPRALVNQVIERTDGIPLFLEEFTKSVIENESTSPDSKVESAGSGKTAPVPISLHDSLMERLDRVGPAKSIARVGAVIGRNFTRELVLQVGEFDPVWFEAALAQLVEAGLLHRSMDPRGREQFAFRHGLVQDTAYNSILREYRQKLHAKTAQVLETLRPDVAEERPELLAQHLTEAGLAQRAADLWLQAGRRGVAQSAIVEAAHHLQRGLEALDQLPRNDATQRQRLQALTLLGPATIALRGPGSREAERIYAEGFEICRALPESHDHFPIYWGWWRLSRDFREMESRADELQMRATAQADDELLLQAHHCQWASHFNRGDFTGCLAHIDEGLALYDGGDYRSHATLYGNHDAKVCGYGEQALVYWLLGRPEAALRQDAEAQRGARLLGHAGSSMHLRDIALTHQLYRRDAREVQRHADGMIDFADEHGFTDHHAKALVYCGWAKAVLGDPESGLAEIGQGLARQKEIGTSEDFPIYYDMYAEVLMLNGRLEEALAEISEAEQEFQNIGLRIWAPEVRRRRGQILERLHPKQPEQAIAVFREALDLASQQGVAMLGLRAAVSLANALGSESEVAKVHSILEPWLSQSELLNMPEYAAVRARMTPRRENGR